MTKPSTLLSTICKFRPDISTGIGEADIAMAAKMRVFANAVNELKDNVEISGEHHLKKKSLN